MGLGGVLVESHKEAVRKLQKTEEVEKKEKEEIIGHTDHLLADGSEFGATELQEKSNSQYNNAYDNIGFVGDDFNPTAVYANVYNYDDLHVYDSVDNLASWRSSARRDGIKKRYEDAESVRVVDDTDSMLEEVREQEPPTRNNRNMCWRRAWAGCISKGTETYVSKFLHFHPILWRGEVESWDVFKNIPSDGDGRGEGCYEMVRKIFKLVLICVLFVLNLASALVNKGSLLLMTSQIGEKDVDMRCKQYNASNTGAGHFTYTCARLPHVPENMPLMFNDWCLQIDNSSGKYHLQQTFQRGTCDTVAIRWMWGLVCLIATPYVFVFIRCMYRACTKSLHSPSKDIVFIVLLVETLHVVGVCLFTFCVLPYLHDAAHGVIIMSAMSFMPAFLNMFSNPPPMASAEAYPPSRPTSIFLRVLDVLAFVCQLSALLLWPILAGVRDGRTDTPIIWALPTSLILISLGWWENYIDEFSSLGGLAEAACHFKRRIRRVRTKVYLIVVPWKLVVLLLMLMALASPFYSMSDLFGFWWRDGNCKGKLSPLEIDGLNWEFLAIFLVNTAAGFVAYFCARTATKVQVQAIGYALPLLLSGPVFLASLIGFCETWNKEPCWMAALLPAHLHWRCYSANSFITELVVSNGGWVYILWWLSQLWITSHMWFPRSERLAKTNKIFVLPLYDNVLLEAWLYHNRQRRDECQNTGSTLLSSKDGPGARVPTLSDLEENYEPDETPSSTQEPMIYICATMWHETESEMIAMFKSIFKLDIDQIARRKAKLLGVEDPDCYDFEAHIFFDDAMEGYCLGDQDYKVNSFVKNVVRVVDKAGSIVHGVEQLGIKAPTKLPTPYGGRLVWTLPGGNNIIVHVKDKMKIRHKKRWSQVMYMYYFLGYRLWAAEESLMKKQTLADNTFLLALDGDVDFEPHAVRLLVDLMKKDENVGAACGRIHPTGSGPMVWYQQFEYALGHWMQKSTEHVFGCVLCSPGCFSLFRGSALMNNNVMKTYTTKSSEARHYVQYDQGEDRWLCTLLLQQGWRVEYCAASDSYTMAPEGFNEFYNQRRRWTPSTMANILDLLVSWKHTTKVNQNISLPYILYQSFLFITTMLGSGTIFLMIVGALGVATNGFITIDVSFIINFIPLLIFGFMCFLAKSDTQLFVAMILTALYAILQMLVLISIVVQISEDGFCSPTAMFFFYMTGTFLLAAILHPQEFFCVLHFILYFLSIPSMYLLLMMYSLTNLNNVSWGTREVKPTKTEQEEAQLVQEMAERKKGKGRSILKKFSNISSPAEDDAWTISIGDMCKLSCCPRPAKQTKDVLLYETLVDKLKHMDWRLESMDKKMDSVLVGNGQQVDNMAGEVTPEPSNDDNWKLKRSTSVTIVVDDRLTNNPLYDGSDNEEAEADAEEEMQAPPRDELVNPMWIEDEDLGDGPIEFLPEAELIFFKGLIHRYLLPLEKNKAQEERIAQELKDLRNKTSATYFLMNITFIVVVFGFQANVEKVSIPWPCGENLRLEPIGFALLIVFGVILLLQTIGMICHRMGTFLHIVSTTNLNMACGKNKDFTSSDAIQLAREMCTLNRDESPDTPPTGTLEKRPIQSKRKTLYKLAKRVDHRPIATDIDTAFEQRLQKLSKELDTTEDVKTIEKNVIGRRMTGKLSRQKSISAISYIVQKQRERKISKESSVSVKTMQGAQRGRSASNVSAPQIGFSNRSRNQAGFRSVRALTTITDDSSSHKSTPTGSGRNLLVDAPRSQRKSVIELMKELDLARNEMKEKEKNDPPQEESRL